MSPASEPPSPAEGALTLVGRLIEASNATFVVADAEGRRFVYKPVVGEAPLWDFPRRTLSRREVAAYELSLASGFGVVPPTRWITDGPLGQGSLQDWVEAGDSLALLVKVGDIPPGWHGIVLGVDADDHEVALVHADDPRLRRLALFDVVVNNADRKAGHILATDGPVFGVDHGVTFHTDPKLRTILWGWSGDPLLDNDRTLLAAVLAVAEETLGPWLRPDEVTAVLERTQALLDAGTFPEPGDAWPVIPWPPI